jgi:hypothetical protein
VNVVDVFVLIYGNRRLKLDEIVLRSGEEEGWRV